MRMLLAPIFAASPAICYVAVYRNGVLDSAARSDLGNVSSSELDKYEELSVTPHC